MTKKIENLDDTNYDEPAYLKADVDKFFKEEQQFLRQCLELVYDGKFSDVMFNLDNRIKLIEEHFAEHELDAVEY